MICFAKRQCAEHCLFECANAAASVPPVWRGCAVTEQIRPRLQRFKVFTLIIESVIINHMHRKTACPRSALQWQNTGLHISDFTDIRGGRLQDQNRKDETVAWQEKTESADARCMT